MPQALGEETREHRNGSNMVPVTKKHQSTTPLVPTPVCTIGITGRDFFFFSLNRADFFKNLFILFYLFLFLAVLGLCCHAQVLLFVAVRGRLIAVASLVVEHGLLASGLQ